MTFTPVLHPLLLAPIFIAALVFTVWWAVKSRGRGRGIWVERTALVLLCFLLLLRPGIPGGKTQTLATDTDIVLVVDTTASIVAEDWNGGKPRLDGIRADVQKIIEHYPGARYAIITFDRNAVLRLPLTTDTNAVKTSLDVLRPEVTTQSRGSSIGIAASLLTTTLQEAAKSQENRSRMVFYLGDGEQTVATQPESFADAKKYVDGGMVFGYGTQSGGPMRITSGRSDSGREPRYIEYQGQDAKSVIDEKNLKTIADQLGVPYATRTAEANAALPDAPAGSTTLAASGSSSAVIELYWIIALGIIALLGFELARATYYITRMRGLAIHADAPKGGDA